MRTIKTSNISKNHNYFRDVLCCANRSCLNLRLVTEESYNSSTESGHWPKNVWRRTGRAVAVSQNTEAKARKYNIISAEIEARQSALADRTGTICNILASFFHESTGRGGLNNAETGCYQRRLLGDSSARFACQHPLPPKNPLKRPLHHRIPRKIRLICWSISNPPLHSLICEIWIFRKIKTNKNSQKTQYYRSKI